MNDEYHVGVGTFGIYAGTFKKSPSKYAREHGLNEWKNKDDVTQEALEAVAEYLISSQGCFSFSYGGKEYVLTFFEKDKK